MFMEPFAVGMHRLRGRYVSLPASLRDAVARSCVREGTKEVRVRLSQSGRPHRDGHGIGRIGAADLMPAGKGAVADCLEPSARGALFRVALFRQNLLLLLNRGLTTLGH
jgi:hypothetical protein